MPKLKPTGREVKADGQPLITIEEKLLAEVERTAERHQAAITDLRRWRLSHGEEPRQSVYESTGALRLSTDDVAMVDGVAARFR